MRRTPSPSIEAVALSAGVSVATVSRAFHESSKLASETRRRVLEVAQGLGYYPRVVPNKRNKVAVVLGARTHLGRDPYLAQVVGALLEGLHERRLRTIVQLASSSADLTAAVEEGFFDALVVLGGPQNAAAWNLPYPGGRGVRELAARLPVVLVNHDLGAPTHTVASDHAQGGRLVAEYLLARGHRKVAYVAPGVRSAVLDARRDGALGALRKAGVAQPEALCFDAEDLPLVEALSRVKHRGATAMILGRQQLTLPALRALHLLNLRVPDDLSVVGFEGPGISAYTNPPLTTVRQPIEELGARAAALTAELLAREGRPRRRASEMLTNELLERESVRALEPGGRHKT